MCVDDLAIQGGGLNLERRNLERPLCRNFEIASIKITKNELFDSFIFEFIFLFPIFIFNINI